MDKPSRDEIIKEINELNLKKRLYIFERTGIIENIFCLERYVKNHPGIKRATNLAYVEQFEQYLGRSDWEQNKDFPIDHGEYIHCSAENHILFSRLTDEQISRQTHRVDLQVEGLASSIDAIGYDLAGYMFLTKDNTGHAENVIFDRFMRIGDPIKGAIVGHKDKYRKSKPHWNHHYDHATIVTVSDPKFTKELAQAGRDIRAYVQVFPERTK